jgi:quinol monooxygenase YgiN
VATQAQRSSFLIEVGPSTMLTLFPSAQIKEYRMSKLTRRGLLAGGATMAAIPFLAGEVQGGSIAKPEMPKDGAILVAMVKAKPGEEEAVKQALMSLVEPTRKEPGCLCYNLHQSKTDKAQFMFYEQWASKDALTAHSKTPHMKALGARLKGRTEKGGATSYELLM